MANPYVPKQLFKFNLIPPKTREELMMLQERDNSILNSFILIFIGVFIFFILTIIQGVVIAPRLAISKSTIANKDQLIASYDPVKKVKGELFVKAQSLEPILNKDIKISQLLKASESITAKVPNSRVLTYSREVSGDFVLTFVVHSFKDVSDLLVVMKNESQIKSVLLRSLVNDSKGSISAVIVFGLVQQ